MLKRIALAAVCLVLLVFIAILFDVPAREMFWLSRFPDRPPSIPALLASTTWAIGFASINGLTLESDGTFHCNWTGYLGEYGSTAGNWGRDGDTIYVSATNATDMFLQSPLENMKLVTHNKQPRLISMDGLDFVGEHGDDSIPMAAFSPTD